MAKVVFVQQLIVLLITHQLKSRTDELAIGSELGGLQRKTVLELNS